MLLGCIGDDFTGSSDLANTLAKHGMRVTQYSGVPRRPAAAHVEAGVVALKSSTIPSEEAVAQSLEALAWLRAQGCRQFLFKYCSTFDSTPEGNIGPVAAALANALDARKVIVCPAFPQAGRTIYLGHLFVNDRLLNESGMENHPLTPMSDADIRRWLSRQTAMTVGHIAYHAVGKGVAGIVEGLDRADAQGARLVVVDAVSDENLSDIGTAAADLPLLTGGSGIAMGLPDNFRRKGLLSGETGAWHGVDGPCVVLSGSCSNATRGQVARHIKQGLPAFEIQAADAVDGKLDGGDLARWALGQSERALIYSSAEPEVVRTAQEKYGRDRVAGAIEGLFGTIARELVRAGAGRLITAGGETSGAIVEALSVEALEIGPEIAPGVPALRSDLSGGHPLALALKSGNFGGPNFFAEAAEILRGTPRSTTIPET